MSATVTPEIATNPTGSAFVTCEPCDLERWFKRRHAAEKCATDHNKTRHKEVART